MIAKVIPFRPRRQGASPRQRARQPGHWRCHLALPLRWLGVVAVVALLAVAFQQAGRWLMDPLHFPLSRIEVQGQLRNLAHEDFSRALGGYLEGGFFGLKVEELRQRLAREPWVEQVTVRRSWPDTVQVELRERNAFAFWGREEMVDMAGRRFRPRVIRESQPWPRLAGPDGHEKTMIEAYRQASALLADTGLAITRLVQDERRAWRVVLDNGVELRLGREGLWERLQLFAQVYPQVLAPRSAEIEAVDLRYTNGFAVSWKSPPATGRSG